MKTDISLSSPATEESIVAERKKNQSELWIGWVIAALTLVAIDYLGSLGVKLSWFEPLVVGAGTLISGAGFLFAVSRHHNITDLLYIGHDNCVYLLYMCQEDPAIKHYCEKVANLGRKITVGEFRLLKQGFNKLNSHPCKQLYCK